MPCHRIARAPAPCHRIARRVAAVSGADMVARGCAAADLALFAVTAPRGNDTGTGAGDLAAAACAVESARGVDSADALVFSRISGGFLIQNS